MGYIGIFDCGTTNSRFNLVDRNGTVVGSCSAKVGVKDTALRGDNRYLKEELEKLYFRALTSIGLKESDVDAVISSGMITSELGLLELPHLVAPAGLGEIVSGLKHLESDIGLGIRSDLYLVRGIKNRPNPPSGGPLDAVGALDFMRGEETQVMGLLAKYGQGIPTTVVNLSSHTKSISVGSDGKINGSVTTLSGQVYESLLKETFIGKSISPPAEPRMDEKTFADDGALLRQIAEATELAYGMVRETGLLRSFLVPRFMDTLMVTDWRVRKRFFEAAIAADDLKSFSLFPEYGFEFGKRLFLIGVKERCELYASMLHHSPFPPETEVHIICDKEEVDLLAIMGALAIAKSAGIVDVSV